MNAETAEIVGILKLKMYHMEFTKMFRHPKYYKELRKRNKSDQVISLRAHDGECERAPDQGLKLQAREDIIHEENERLLDRSSKRQASSAKLLKPQAASIKPKA